MPIIVTRDDAARRFTAIAEGAVTVADILGFMGEPRAGGYRAYSLLLDLANADDLAVTAADIRRFVERGSHLQRNEGPRGPVAVVARQAAIYGAGRMFEALAELRGLPPVRTFHSTADALMWLRANEPPAGEP
jgi:hypothetical protein